MRGESEGKALAAEPVSVFSAERQTGIGAVVRDFVEGFGKYRIWRAFAAEEIGTRYKKSALGIAWIIISFVIFVVAISVFFGSFSSRGMDGFAIYVAPGFALFTFLTASLSDGCSVFKTSQSWIKAVSMPYSIYIYQSVAKSLFTFVLQMVFGLLLIGVFFGWRPEPIAFLAIPWFFVLLINALWIQYLLGILASRFADINHLITTVQRLLFFTTPILWIYEEREGWLQRIADINPFTHYIEVVRAPLLGGMPMTHSMVFVGAYTVIGWLACLLIGGQLRRRIPFLI